jgi:hypothetical protein
MDRIHTIWLSQLWLGPDSTRESEADTANKVIQQFALHPTQLRVGCQLQTSATRNDSMKLFALMLIAFVAMFMTADAHDGKRMLRMLQGGKPRGGNAPARPATIPDEKKVQDEKKAQAEKMAREKREQKLQQLYGGRLVGHSDPNARNRFVTERPSPSDR